MSETAAISDAIDWLKRFLEALLGHSGGMEGAGAAPGSVVPQKIVVAPVLTPSSSVAILLTPDLLRKLGANSPETCAPELVAACAEFAITTPRRIAAFLANILTETGGFTSLVENMNYSTEALLKQWPSHFTPAAAQQLGRNSFHPADQRGIAETAYGNRMGNGPPGSGDGWLFRGHGLMQLTGKESYQKHAAAIGKPLAELPNYLTTPVGAATSAAWEWNALGCSAFADVGNLTKVRLLINGGTIGLDLVTHRYNDACKALGIR